MTGLKPLFGAIALFLIAVALGLNGLDGEFIYDDETYVTHNASVLGEASIFRESTPPTIQTVDRTTADGTILGLYRPVTILSYRLDYLRSGLDPYTCHLTNLLLHALTVVGVFLLARTALPLRLALVAGLLFAVHPLHVEAYAWVVGRAEILATLFALVALLAFRRRGPGVQYAPIVAGVATFAAGLCKESALPLPGMLLLLDHGSGRTRAERIRRLLPSVVATVTLVFLRYAILGRFGPDVSSDPLLGSLSLFERIGLGLGVMWRVVSRWLVPYDLSIAYSLDDIASPFAAIAGGIVCAGLVVATFRRGARESIGLPLFAVAMVPFLHIVPIGALFGDRFAYLPSVGLAIATGEAIRACGARATFIAGSLLAVGIPLLGIGTVQRNRVFHDELALWRDAVEKNPDQALTQYLLGREYEKVGLLDFRSDQVQGALVHIQRSLDLDRRHPLAHYAELSLGVDAAGRQNDPRAAAKHYRAALTLQPLFADALLHLVALEPSGAVRTDEALDWLTRALRLPLRDDQRAWAEDQLVRIRDREPR